MQQVIQFTERRRAGALFDKPPAPVVRAGIAQRAEDPSQALGLEGARAELQLERIDGNGVGAGKITATIDKSAGWRPVPVSG